MPVAKLPDVTRVADIAEAGPPRTRRVGQDLAKRRGLRRRSKQPMLLGCHLELILTNGAALPASLFSGAALQPRLLREQLAYRLALHRNGRGQRAAP